MSDVVQLKKTKKCKIYQANWIIDLKLNDTKFNWVTSDHMYVNFTISLKSLGFPNLRSMSRPKLITIIYINK